MPDQPAIIDVIRHENNAATANWMMSFQDEGLPAYILRASAPTLVLRTPEGHKAPAQGDYIIRSEKGEFHHYQPAQFEALFGWNVYVTFQKGRKKEPAEALNEVVTMMFYRLNAERRALNPDHRLSQWQCQMVTDQNSAKTDGETFDLVRHYQENPSWEVVIRPISLPL